MSKELTFTHNGKEFQANMERIGKKMFRYVRASYGAMGRRWVKTVKLRASAPYTGNKNRTGPYSGPTSSARLQKRTGALAASIKSEVKGNSVGTLTLMLEAGGATGGRWGGSGGYAALQEYGGVIKPKRAKSLLIPLPNALTPKGRVKKEARIVRRGKKYSTKGFGPTFIRNGVVFAQKQGSFQGVSGQARALYVLKKSVRVHGRLGATGTIMNIVHQSIHKIAGGVLRVILMDPAYPAPADGK